MKNDTIFQDKLDDLKLQMAMQLLGQKELEESEKEIENLNSLPEAQPTLYEQQLVIKTIDRALRQQRLKHTFSTAKQNNQTTTSNFPCNFNFAVSNMNRFNQGIYHG